MNRKMKFLRHVAGCKECFVSMDSIPESAEIAETLLREGLIGVERKNGKIINVMITRLGLERIRYS